MATCKITALAVVFLTSALTCTYCYVIVEDDLLRSGVAEGKISNSLDNDLSGKPEDRDKVLMQSTIINLDENDDFEMEGALKEAIAVQFGIMLDHLVAGDELNRDSKLDVIARALESAFLSITGTVDQEFVDNILSSFQEREKKREIQNREHEFNRMDRVEED